MAGRLLFTHHHTIWPSRMTAILVLLNEGHANKRTALPYDSLVGASSYGAPVPQDAARIAT